MRKEEKKEISLFLLLIVVSLLLFFLKPTIVWLEKPFLAAEEKIYSLFLPRQKQADKVQILEGKLRQLASEQNQLSSCLEENEKMKRLLGAPLPAQWKFLPTKVIGLTEQMKIDKGEKDGVKKGMMVISENILVGRVTTVDSHSSLIQIPTSANSKIPVVVREISKTGIQARGILASHSGGLLLDKVLQEEDIRKGDLVATAGEAGWLPDLLIGQIEEVLAKSAEIYKKAQVSPLVDYQKLRTIFVVISN